MSHEEGDKRGARQSGVDQERGAEGDRVGGVGNKARLNPQLFL